jgi:hypothetical protein
MRMNLPSDCNACIHTLRLDHKQTMSLSQLLCTYYNKGSHMLSIVDTWGCMQYFFKSCFAMVTTSFCSVSLTRMHWHLVSQGTKQSYTKNYNALVYNINQATQSFSQWVFLPICLMRAWLIATDDVLYTTSVNKAFPLKYVLCLSYNYLLIMRQLKVWLWSTELLCPPDSQ